MSLDDKVYGEGNNDMDNEIDTQESTKTTERLINLLKLKTFIEMS